MKHLQEILIEISQFKYAPAMYHTLQTYYFEASQIVQGVEAQNYIANAQMIMHQETIDDSESKPYSVSIAQGEIKLIESSSAVAAMQYTRIKARQETLKSMVSFLKETCGTVSYEVAFLYELGEHTLPKPPLAELIQICSGQDKLLNEWAPTFIQSLENANEQHDQKNSN